MLNNHIAHLSPCLEKWILNSKKCPVCNVEFHPLIMKKFQEIIEMNAKKEKEKKQKEQEQKAISNSLKMLEEAEQKVKILEKLEQSQKLMNENKITASLDILFDILDHHDPKNLDAMFLIGKAHFLNNRYDLAISDLMKLVKIEFSYPYAFYYLGKSFHNIGLNDKAKWAYERSIITMNKIMESAKTPEQIENCQKIVNEVSNILKIL